MTAPYSWTTNSCSSSFQTRSSSALNFRTLICTQYNEQTNPWLTGSSYTQQNDSHIQRHIGNFSQTFTLIYLERNLLNKFVWFPNSQWTWTQMTRLHSILFYNGMGKELFKYMRCFMHFQKIVCRQETRTGLQFKSKLLSSSSNPTAGCDCE